MRRLILCIWLLLGIGYWYLAKYHCQQPYTIEKEIIAPSSSANDINSKNTLVKKTQKLSPIAFSCSSSEPLLEAQWNAFKDSILSTLNDDRILQIKGQAFADENSNYDITLGMSRAQVIGELFDLPKDKIRIKDGIKNGNCSNEEKYNFITFKSLLNTSKIKEIDDRTIIYFLFNSTQKLNDTEVENYLNDVATRVQKSGEQIRITGHTDDNGELEANIKLGQARADIIKSYLLSKGLSDSKIESLSKGESDPIRSNETGEGRASNRRAELEILSIN